MVGESRMSANAREADLLQELWTKMDGSGRMPRIHGRMRSLWSVGHTAAEPESALTCSPPVLGGMKIAQSMTLTPPRAKPLRRSSHSIS